MKAFSAPLDDILFSLKHVAGAGHLAGWDDDLAGEIARHFADFASMEIAPLDETGDRQGCRIEDGRVLMPEGFRCVYQSYAEQGWAGLTAPEDFGGQGLGDCLLAITSEIFAGANHSLQMVTGLVPGAIRTLLGFGNARQQAQYIPLLVAGEALATMCLTEAGAGSDLSGIRCAATPDGNGWRIDGEKIFISGGDQDISDQILHLVLARTSDAGVKGLSLFVCPSLRSDHSPNGVSVARLEEKMGLHASPTCHLVFEGAEAELLGAEGEGLKAMFTMMNHARADVALQGVAHAARSHDIATHYAAERLQGRGRDGHQVSIDQHADVRRMLDEMDSLALGGRAIAHIAAVAIECGENADLAAFLTPVAKVYGTQAGISAANLGLQVLGGYGYLREYRIEQTWRDARITAIYEGANGIHSRALVTRLLEGASGKAFEHWLGHQTEAMSDEGYSASVAIWQRARADVLGRADATPLAEDFMQLTAAVMLHGIWLTIKARADAHPQPERLARVAQTSLKRLPHVIQFHAGLLQD